MWHPSATKTYHPLDRCHNPRRGAAGPHDWGMIPMALAAGGRKKGAPGRESAVIQGACPPYQRGADTVSDLPVLVCERGFSLLACVVTPQNGR